MNNFFLTLLLFIVIFILVYLLYNAGYGFVSSKRAIIFVATKWGKKASFTSCSGYIKRAVRFHEDALVDFSFACELTKGNVTVELLDRNKQLLLHLDSATPSGHVAVNKNQRYSLVIRFHGATGAYSLDWC